jgi:hypothetical protein
VEHGGVWAEEDPQPPPVVRLASQVLEHSPARLVDMEVPCCRVASPDSLIEGGQQHRQRLQDADEGPLGNLEAVCVKRGGDAFQRPAEHVLLHQQPGEELRGEASLQDRLRRNLGDQHAGNRAMAGPTVGRTAMDDPHDPYLPVDLLGGLLAEGRIR